MKLAIISVEDALRLGYLDSDEQWEGEELIITEDGYAYLDDVANDPIKGNWDFQEALESGDFQIVEDALEALESGDFQIVEDALEALESGDFQIVEDALEALESGDFQIVEI